MQNEMYFDNEQQDIPKNVRRRKKQLYEQLKERMEFYFSDSNLQKDRFLSKLIQDDPQVDLNIFLRFNRIQQLTSSLHDLKRALKKSDVLELNEDKTKVFRKTPIKEKPNVDACTIYVEQLACDADHDWLKLIFSRYGKVDYVSIPKYKNTGKIKGFAFVEFETPEAANAALEEFEKEGCCLTNHMDPEKLCSIATFEEDKFDAKNQSQPKNEKNTSQSVMVTEEGEVKKVTKRKHEETEEEEEDNESKSEEIKKKKKLDVEETKDQNERNNLTESTVQEETPVNRENESQDQEKPEQAEIDVPAKKKKNRKKKKSLKTKYVKDIKMYGLQILSKTDWKKLRNKYLNIQKEKMKKLKQHLYRSHNNHKQQPVNNQVTNTVETSTKPRFQFSKGLVLKVVFDEPLKDANQVTQFKCEARSLDKVEYVDVDVGSKEGYIRFKDEFAVQQTMKSKPWDSISVLEGEEEQEYWERIKQHRNEKYENKSKFKKKRGRNKLINKTEKLMSKKIRLSVDE